MQIEWLIDDVMKFALTEIRNQPWEGFSRFSWNKCHDYEHECNGDMEAEYMLNIHQLWIKQHGATEDFGTEE